MESIHFDVVGGFNRFLAKIFDPVKRREKRGWTLRRRAKPTRESFTEATKQAEEDLKRRSGGA